MGFNREDGNDAEPAVQSQRRLGHGQKANAYEVSVPKLVNGKTLFTYSDYVQLPDDGKRHEIIDGEHSVTPSPATRHQRISGHLYFQLNQAIHLAGLGDVLSAPTDVVLSDTDIVVPDLLVVLAANRKIITKKNVQGAPDLIVEITAPSTGARDREEKCHVYEKHGVPEYWVVLAEDDAVEKFCLAGDVYANRGLFHDRVDLDVLEGVSVDLTRLWE